MLLIPVSNIAALSSPVLKVSLVYDKISPLANPEDDSLLDRLLLIHKTVVNARVHSHGPPPFNLELQREWYQEALLDSINAAARNLKGHSTVKNHDTLGPSQGRHF